VHLQTRKANRSGAHMGTVDASQQVCSNYLKKSFLKIIRKTRNLEPGIAGQSVHTVQYVPHVIFPIGSRDHADTQIPIFNV
jgi:hypothetical protein